MQHELCTYHETQSPASAKKQTHANAERKMLFTFKKKKRREKERQHAEKEEGGEACGRPGR